MKGFGSVKHSLKGFNSVKSNMNPRIVSIIKKTQIRKSSALSKVSNNDMINDKTIDHFIGKAFKRQDLKKEMKEYYEKLSIYETKIAIRDRMIKKMKKEKVKFDPETWQPPREKKEIKPLSFLSKVKQQNDARQNFYKDILKHSYPSLFVDGFEIKSIDTELEGLTPEDKAEIIEYVVNALELNL